MALSHAICGTSYLLDPVQEDILWMLSIKQCHPFSSLLIGCAYSVESPFHLVSRIYEYTHSKCHTQTLYGRIHWERESVHNHSFSLLVDKILACNSWPQTLLVPLCFTREVFLNLYNGWISSPRTLETEVHPFLNMLRLRNTLLDHNHTVTPPPFVA